jgi:AraC-like DNA-binding protein
MRKKNSVPGIDRAIAAQSGGVSRDGQPLSYNRAPRRELAPWIGRLYVSDVAAPREHRLDCGLFNDTSMLRVQLSGQWRAETIAGPMELGRAALYFGPQSRRMAVAVTGPFCSVGVALRPGACHALRGPKAADHLDRISGIEVLGLEQESVLSRFRQGMEPEAMLKVMEGLLLDMIEKCGASEPDPLTVRFENAAYLDPTISIGQFARECGVDQRRLERVVRRDFGMAPKQVLRRSRALDMASHLRGVADKDEAEELALRYYDQSHLIREFIELFGMSPSQFVALPQPLLTLALESRQARRLEAIDRIAPGDLRPWQ